MTDEATTEVPVSLPELTEEWTADDLREHLETYHVGKHRGARLTSHMRGRDQRFDKCRKSSLIDVHSRLHTDEHYTTTNKHLFNIVEHEHFALPETDELAPDGEKLKAGDAPLLKTDERRILKDLVDSDFAGLRNEIIQMADDALAQSLKLVDEEFKGAVEQARRFTEKKTKLARKQAEEATKLRNKHDDELASLIEEARAAGVVLPSLNSNEFQPENRDQRIEEVKAENKRDRDRALNTLERKRLGTQRTVLLTGLTGTAQLVLDQIPDAQRLMIEAAQERVQRENAAKAIATAAQ